MKIGVSLPVRELEDDLAAIRDFAGLAEELGFTHLRIPEQIAGMGDGGLACRFTGHLRTAHHHPLVGFRHGFEAD